MICSRCGADKDLTEFYYRKDRGRHVNPCKSCSTQEYHSKKHTKEYKERYLNNHLKRKYNINLQERRRLEKKQQSKCAICEERRKLHVDHCHKSGDVRGLLCNKCNLILGQLNDDIKIVENLRRYLEVTNGR